VPFSAAALSDGSFGIDEGLIFGFPIISDGQSWSIVKSYQVDDFARQKIASTLAELQEERKIAEKNVLI
jgi:malate dehydrogenase